MAQSTEKIVQSLNEISKKLDGVRESFSSLIESINKLGKNSEAILKELINKVTDYTTKASETSKDDFDVTRNLLNSVNNEMDKIRQGIGMKQILRISDSLDSLLDLLGGADFNPKDIKTKLSEISNYIETQKK